MYHDRTAWRCAFFVGKKYGSKGYSQGNAAHMGSISLWITFALETTETEENSPRTATIITDSRISLYSIKDVNNHSYLIEDIRNRLHKLEISNWIVAFAWVKAHAGILGNELADQLAKTAARGKDKTTSYSRIRLSTLYKELKNKPN
jgi:hypothetical protein